MSSGRSIGRWSGSERMNRTSFLPDSVNTSRSPDIC
ncbi:hypothetical protein EVA_22285 [gut metagenome]|uniref:Uncharacterized protein n=1 Tax=gut metagenome TaxID=749906 RepID=J9FQI2_9ZZZZ